MPEKYSYKTVLGDFLGFDHEMVRVIIMNKFLGILIEALSTAFFFFFHKNSFKFNFSFKKLAVCLLS